MSHEGSWMICPTCSGDGKHSRSLGVVNPNDFSPDEWDDYMRGGYDSTCGTCNGEGKVRDNEELRERLRDQRNWERGVNDAGERLFSDSLM